MSQYNDGFAVRSRREKPGGRVRTRRRMISAGKRLMLLGTLALTAAIIGVAWWNSRDTGGRLVLSGVEKTEENATRMIKPRYYGVDSKNRPFTVIAETAEQLPDGRVSLRQVNADMMLEASKWLALIADKGLINADGDNIELRNDIQMFYEGGYEFRSDYAMVETDIGRVWGNAPITAQGPGGNIRAKRFEVLDHGEVLKFMDDVHVTLYLD